MLQLNKPKIKKMLYFSKENISLRNNKTKSFERNVKFILSKHKSKRPRL